MYKEEEPEEINIKTTSMNSTSLYNRNGSSSGSGSSRKYSNNNNNNRMSIHLLLNAAEEVDSSEQQVQNKQMKRQFLPNVLIPSINLHLKQRNEYSSQGRTDSSFHLYSSQFLQGNKTEDIELEAIEFLSKVNHIKNNINNVFQGLKRQNSFKWNHSCQQNNIYELNRLSQQLINICQETKKRSISNNNNTSKNSMLKLPFTVNNNSHKKSKFYYISKQKLENVHSINVITTEKNLTNNQDQKINISQAKHSTNYKMINKKKVISKAGINSNGIKRNHEMDGKPCSHCLSVEKTPEWRSGPYGSEQKICNACGLFYRKLKQKFGIDKANIIMAYRKLKCATNRRVPPVFDVPLEFKFEQQQQQDKKVQVDSWCVQKRQSEITRDAINTQLVSPVVTPVIKGSMTLLNSNDLSLKEDPHINPTNTTETVSVIDN